MNYSIHVHADPALMAEHVHATSCELFQRSGYCLHSHSEQHVRSEPVLQTRPYPVNRYRAVA